MRTKLDFKNSFSLKLHSFTLSEVLITLAIIGIIAAITVPVVIANHRKQEITTRLKKFHSTMSNVFKLAALDNGGLDSDLWLEAQKNRIEFSCGKGCWSSWSGHSAGIFQVLFPYMKQYLRENQFDEQEYNRNNELNLSKFYMIDGSYFYPANHVHGLVYKDGIQYNALSIAYDINGDKGPNKHGRDIFWIEYFPSGITNKDIVVNLGTPYISSSNRSTNKQNCKKYSQRNSEAAAMYCFNLIYQDSFEIKDDYPIKI